MIYPGDTLSDELNCIQGRMVQRAGVLNALNGILVAVIGNSFFSSRLPFPTVKAVAPSPQGNERTKLP